MNNKKQQNNSNIEESFLVRAFTEIMPDVKFIDVTPKASGDIAGGARKKLEKRLGRSVVTNKNFLKNPENKKQLKK